MTRWQKYVTQGRAKFVAPWDKHLKLSEDYVEM
jgi:hypothetical protein